MFDLIQQFNEFGEIVEQIGRGVSEEKVLKCSGLRSRGKYPDFYPRRYERVTNAGRTKGPFGRQVSNVDRSLCRLNIGLTDKIFGSGVNK